MSAVYRVRADLCEYGLTTNNEKGTGVMPAKKPTGFLTNTIHIAQLLSRRYSGTHKHQPLMGGRAGPATRYARKLCEEIVTGLVAQKQADETGTRPAGVMHLRGMTDLQRSEIIQQGENLHEAAGDEAKLQMEQNDLIKWQIEHAEELEAKDDVSGTPLDPVRVIKARITELTFFKKMGVYSKVRRQ